MHSRVYVLRRASSPRSFHTVSRANAQVLKEKTAEKASDLHRDAPNNVVAQEQHREREGYPEQNTNQRFAKRNEVGVQLLSRSLHSQIFKNVTFPPPKDKYVRISREHLKKHKLDPTLSSTHPDISFTLPPLHGPTIDAHFHAIGTRLAEPYLSLSKKLSTLELPPQPESWVLQSGWTKYWTGHDGVHESVDAPNEEMLVFDVETLPNYSPYAIMACAASPTGWYAWISPWLLGESQDPAQLIPLGNPAQPRIVVGHNVCYDRPRTLEEYHLDRPGTRWLDTMSLHVAAQGISSHQRPAWSKYRKQKSESRNMKNEAVESVLAMIAELKQQTKEEPDGGKKEDLKSRIREMEESLPSLEATAEVGTDPFALEEVTRWEDLTAANSLADVALLHCGIEVDKSTRDDFMTSTPDAIAADLSTYLTYCANDVAVTHKVFQKTLPAFLQKCPSPVSFSGVCSMGSSILTVDENWERYLENAEGKYQALENSIIEALRDLAEEARALLIGDRWKGDVWLEQLDWTPKPIRNGEDPYEDDYPLSPSSIPSLEAFKTDNVIPKFLNDLLVLGVDDPYVKLHVLPYLLRLQIDDQPVRYTRRLGWHGHSRDTSLPLEKQFLMPLKTTKIHDIFEPVRASRLHKKHRVSRADDATVEPWLTVATEEETPASVQKEFLRLAQQLVKMHSSGKARPDNDEWWPWLKHLEWTLVERDTRDIIGVVGGRNPLVPKWYWQLGKAKAPSTRENLEITTRSRTAPILFKLKWLGWPMVYSREHGWTFRVDKKALVDKSFSTRLKQLTFYDDEDTILRSMSDDKGSYTFFKLPHKDGDSANVGNPLAKTFIKFAADGTLSSPSKAAVEALNINAQCSYWISARDRIMNQMVVWDEDGRQGLRQLASSPDKKWGIILPQVVTMGTVTRRAIEKTWLTASNAKSNRVGSELKAMVRAPEGYAIVGADVDSEELWISSCMGDAQFGFHGATAIGWMTLEGTKKAGTDLHSKTASILGISRDQAKVFNYSRIYGAGMKHAVLLLLQGNASMLPDQAQKLAEQLYASTKGKNTYRNDLFGNKFWYGGTESFLFNKLEQIALSDEPKTPALGCGVTSALSKQYLPEKFGSDYLPSRINWVVQSSGVDYLHLLIVAMEHLIQTYDINARYLISVHDELRYLVKEEDKYRAALALQIANLWTRSMFAYRLGMDDLPQGVAFFSAVDVDKVLRKEVDMPCVTPSHPNPIPPGESLDILSTLEKTNGGTLQRDGTPMALDTSPSIDPALLSNYVTSDCLTHRAKSEYWLEAQATDLMERIKFLAGKVQGKIIDPHDDRKTEERNKMAPKSRARKQTTKFNIKAVEDWDESVSW